jgi:hypothetical protein
MGGPGSPSVYGYPEYFARLTDQLNRLRLGRDIRSLDENGEPVTLKLKVIAGLCIFDDPAAKMANGLAGHSGTCGCMFCDEKFEYRGGVWVPKDLPMDDPEEKRLMELPKKMKRKAPKKGAKKNVADPPNPELKYIKGSRIYPVTLVNTPLRNTDEHDRLAKLWRALSVTEDKDWCKEYGVRHSDLLNYKVFDRDGPLHMLKILGLDFFHMMFLRVPQHEKTRWVEGFIRTMDGRWRFWRDAHKLVEAPDGSGRIKTNISKDGTMRGTENINWTIMFAITTMLLCLMEFSSADDAAEQLERVQNWAHYVCCAELSLLGMLTHFPPPFPCSHTQSLTHYVYYFCNVVIFGCKTSEVRQCRRV